MALQAARTERYGENDPPSEKSGIRNVQVVRKPKAPSHPTVDQDFSTQYNDPYTRGPREDNDNRALKANDNDARNRNQREEAPNVARRHKPKISASRFHKRRQEAIKLRAAGVSVNGIAQNMRAVRAAWITIWACGVLYIAQVGFWVFGMVGLGLEYGALSLADVYGGNFATRFVADVLSATVPGESIFAVGWMVSSALATVQLFIALAVFYSNRINALQHIALFVIVLALAWLPLGLIPWAVVWVVGVVWSSKKE